LVKDKLGQNLFGDSTFVTYMGHPQASPAGHRLVARFHFEMPRLPPGDYAVTAAVADGTQRDHVSHHWVHDALVFRSTSTSVASGLIGIPMRQIEMQVLPLA
jgi:lipopolysaccharide transport system ATP-binding protein